MSEPTPIVLIDTREQRPLELDMYPVEVATLPVGDYGIKGFSDWSNPEFICERKSLDDLVQSVTFGRTRFWREILKLRQFRFAAVLIEAERGQAEFAQYRSSVSPNVVMQSLAAIQVRYGIHVIWCGNAEKAARTLERLVRQFCRHVENQRRLLSRASLTESVEVGNG